MCYVCRKVEVALHPGLRNVARPQACPNPQPLALSDEEMHELIAASEGNHDLHDAVVLALHTGLRSGELESLRWADIDLTFFKLKASDRTSRNIPLDGAAASALENRHDRSGHLSDFVFGTDPRATIRKIRQKIPTLGGRIGRRIGYHDLRRAWAEKLFRSGVGLELICKLAGWTRPHFLVPPAKARQEYESAVGQLRREQ